MRVGRILVVLCAAFAVGLVVTGTAAADPYKSCKHGGWHTVYRTDGSPFKDKSNCRGYVRRTGNVTFKAVLVGANEVPGPGDPDATGSAMIILNYDQGTVCWQISVANADAITAAHIHAGTAGTAGAVVVPLSPYAGGCTSADPALILRIIYSRDSYYVNVHNAAYPGGAARGQLGA